MTRSVTRGAVFLFLILTGLGGGTALYYVPAYETHFSQTGPNTACEENQCVSTYKLVIGNTGWSTQSNFLVVLPKEFVDDLAAQPRVLRAGKVPLLFRRVDKVDEVELELGSLISGRWLEIEFVAQSQRGGHPWSWEEIEPAVIPKEGQAYPGDPQTLKLRRFLLQLSALI